MSSRYVTFVTVSALGALLLFPRPARALDASNVLVIYNQASAEGAEIASYYAAARPGVSLLAIQNVPTGEVISASLYLSQIRQQVLGALNGNIDCIVTTKGLPLRIDNPYDSSLGVPSYQWSRFSSLESELARIDTISSRALMGNQYMFWGGNPYAYNPYYQAMASGDGHFDQQAYGTRLAARLDGFSVADVKGAIDRAKQAMQGPPGYGLALDDHPNLTDLMGSLHNDLHDPNQPPEIYQAPHQYENTTAHIAKDIVLEDGKAGTAIGYVSHGVHAGVQERYIRDPSYVYGLDFPLAPGAVFHTWESYNAYTFAGDNSVASPKSQGLVAQWIARGGTAGAGNVEEPTSTSQAGVTNENLMFEALLSGLSWAEAAWLATYQLSTVNTVVGDPLMQWKQWIPGDANADGQVNLADFSIFKIHYGEQVTWKEGDFNGDGVANLADMTILKANFGQTAGGATVPEPGALAILSAASLALLARRRRPR